MATVSVLKVTKQPFAQNVDEIFRAHYEFVYRTAFGITGNPEDAEDVAQTLFLRLLNRELPLDLIANPKAYVYRAAVNLSLKTIRQRQRRRVMHDIECLEVPAQVETADEEIDRRLSAAVAELNESAAQILILRYVHNYSLQDIAKLVGTTRSTVAVSLFRSRARIKKSMRAFEGEQL